MAPFKARVIRKSRMRTWYEGVKQVKVFHVMLQDAVGAAIRASFFNAAANNYKDFLQEGTVFTFRHGMIKVQNEVENNCNQSDDFIFEDFAEISEDIQTANVAPVPKRRAGRVCQSGEREEVGREPWAREESRRREREMERRISQNREEERRQVRLIRSWWRLLL
jgi:hypothetical protein